MTETIYLAPPPSCAGDSRGGEYRFRRVSLERKSLGKLKSCPLGCFFVLLAGETDSEWKLKVSWDSILRSE